MSSDPKQHITLSRAHYEEAFLLYVDGELSPEAMDAVDAFTALHPDLREELDLLLETRLDSEAISFGDNSTLLAAGMRRASFEEDLLNHIDGELAPRASAALQAQLDADPALRSEYNLLLQTKLDPAHTIECPDKELLYRREERRRPAAWWRVAAALLLIGSTFAIWQAGQRTLVEDPSAFALPGNGSTASVSPEVRSAATPGSMPAVTDAAAATDERITRRTTEGASTRSGSTVGKPAEKAGQQGGNKQLLAAVPDPRDRSTDNGDALPALPDLARVDRIETGIAGNNELPSQNINSAAVTNAPSIAYHTQNTAAPVAATTAVLREEKSQGSVRGFLRKAARFVEKRTGIRATNDDDQLVVGALAINLK